MAQIALHPWLHTPEARTGTYNGVETALNFGDPTAELGALRTGCGVFPLAWRGRINVTGKDRVRWLHNMVTNNVRDLPENRGNYNFVLNAQGRILGDMYIYCRGDSFALETDASQVETLINAMKRFIIMDKVEMVEVGADSVSVGVCGPKAESVLANAGINANDMQPLQVRDVGTDDVAATLIRGPEQKPGWFELWLDPNKAQELWNLLVKAGAKPVGAEALEMWRVLAGDSELWAGHSRSRFAAGDRTDAGAELHQRLLHWPGDRGAHPIARTGASQVYRLYIRRPSTEARKIRVGRARAGGDHKHCQGSHTRRSEKYWAGIRAARSSCSGTKDCIRRH